MMPRRCKNHCLLAVARRLRKVRLKVVEAAVKAQYLKDEDEDQYNKSRVAGAHQSHGKPDRQDNHKEEGKVQRDEVQGVTSSDLERVKVITTYVGEHVHQTRVFIGSGTPTAEKSEGECKSEQRSMKYSRSLWKFRS